MASRVYIVTDKESQKKRMVKAVSQWQAIKHCVKENMSAHAATGNDVLAFMEGGSKVETASLPLESEVEGVPV